MSDLFGNGNTLFAGPDGQIHPVVSNGNTAIDLSDGTMYFGSGPAVFGTDGSMHTVIGNEGSQVVFGSDGTHPIFGSGSFKTIL